VRYTAILKSRSGASNVFYEGIRCATAQFRRYAFGAQDKFRLSDHSRWQYLGFGNSEPYLKQLSDDFVCPSPSPGKAASLLKRLRRPNPDQSLYGDEE